MLHSDKPRARAWKHTCQPLAAMPKLELEEVGRARTLQCLPVLHLQCGGLTAWLSGSSLQGRAGKSVSSLCKLAGAVLRLQDAGRSSPALLLRGHACA